MDRNTAQLRTLLTGKRIIHKDLRNSRSSSFVVSKVTNSERGFIIIKGDTPFDVIYLPFRASEMLLADRYCIYRETYDTTVVEYEMEICEE